MAGEASDAVAVIGLGSMGLGMALSLVRAGFAVSGYDPAAAALDRLREAGGTPAASPGKAARDVGTVVVVVVNAVQAEAVLFGADGVVPAMRKGGVVLASPTMAPADARRLAEGCEAAGVHYLDAPISGGAAKAAQGELTVMASGHPEAFRLVAPVLDAMATTVYRLGEAPGIGASFKMVNQLLAGVHIAVACEAITFARRLGLDMQMVFEVITASAGNSWMFQNRIPHVLEGDYRPASAVDIFAKDLGIVAAMGLEAKFPTPLAASALQMFLMTSAAGMGRDDDASVARLIARMTGLDLPEVAATG